MSHFLLFYVEESIPGVEIAGTALRVLWENSQHFATPLVSPRSQPRSQGSPLPVPTEREREGGGRGGRRENMGTRLLSSLRDRRLKRKAKGVLGARGTRGARPCSLSPQTLFPNKRINSILMTHHYPDGVVLLIGRATREICFIHSRGLPRSGWWHVISMKFLRAFLWRHFAGKPVVASQTVGCLLRLHVREEKTSFSRAVLERGKCPSAPENGTFWTDR